jgi:hypothetical protein
MRAAATTSGDLTFDAPGRGYGFPVPKSLRDLVVGDDADFFWVRRATTDPGTPAG